MTLVIHHLDFSLGSEVVLRFALLLSSENESPFTDTIY